MEDATLGIRRQGLGGAEVIKRKERLLSAVLLSQAIAFCIALTSLSSTLLASKGLSLPAAQTIPNYALLAAVYGALQLLQRQKPQNGMGGYAAVAILDVEANFLVVLAFRYTFITSVQLLNSFSVPCVFVMSWMALKAQYKLLHCTGAALCLASLVLFVLTDSTDTQAQSPLLGDALAVAGAFMYAACNVTQEKLLRKGSNVEVLAFMGLFGLVLSSLQAAVLERDAIANVTWTPQVGALLAAYTLAMFACYSMVPFVLQWSGAAVLNLSLLSSNLWAALARALLLGGFPQKSAMAFTWSLILVAVGLVLFTCGGTVYPKSSPEDTYRVIRFGDSGGSQQGTPRLSKGSPAARSDSAGEKAAEGVSEGQPLWWRTGRLPKKGSRAADEESQQSDLSKGVESIPEESAEPAACPPVPDSPIARKASGLMGGLQRQGSKFWMISLPSLPVEGALTADPYSRVGASLERKEGAPPVKAPL